MRALEIINQNNLLTIPFPTLGNGVFSFSTDLSSTIMLQTMRDFVTKNSNSLLKIIRVVVNNIRQVKNFTKIKQFMRLFVQTTSSPEITFPV